MNLDQYSVNAKILLRDAIIPLYDNLQLNEIVNGTVEIINFNTIFDMNESYIFDIGSHRKAQHKYIENEKKWYLSMKRDIKGFDGIETNPIWQRISADSGSVNSNYGWCVFSPENANGLVSQYDFALKQLLENKHGRQSVIFYNRPEMQWEWNDNINAKSDFTCTFQTQQFIRNNKFYMIVTMRSNDVIRGLHCGDLPWQGFVYDKFYDDLKKVKYPDLKRGTLMWNAGSLHCYERDWPLLIKIAQEYLEANRRFREDVLEKINKVFKKDTSNENMR